jgi:5'-methylthioadenosine phosphorylase
MLARHGAGHKVPPSRVNYTAMSEALRLLRIDYCFSTAAVGSLDSSMPIGTLCVCSDLLDFSGRSSVRFASAVQHIDMTHPFDLSARSKLIESARLAKIGISEQGVYVCVNGPRYETPAEIEAMRRLGGQLVGMTAGTEAIAMREAGVKYACLAIVTNFAAGLQESPLSHDAVVAGMKVCGENALNVLLGAAN